MICGGDDRGEWQTGSARGYRRTSAEKGAVAELCNAESVLGE